MNRKINITLALMFIISAGARLVYLFRNQYMWWDEAVYLAMAEAFSGNFYMFEYFRPPLWPFLLSVFPKTVFAGKAVSLLISLVAMPVVFRLAKRSLGESKGLLITFFYAFNHFSLFFAGIAATESLCVLLLFVSLFSFYNASLSNSRRDWVLAGLSFGLAVMTRHTAAFFIFPVIAYLIVTGGLYKKPQRCGFLIMLLYSILVLSPWLVSMRILFGNMFYAQLEMVGTSEPVSPIFYLASMPFFLGVQGLLILLTIPHAKKDRFILLSLISFLTGLLLLSLVSHKETRYLMVLLPSIVSLEGLGFYVLIERFRQMRHYVHEIVTAGAMLVFAVVFLFAPVIPEDTELESCLSLAEDYHTENTLSTSAPLLSWANKRPAMQLPEEPSEFTCGYMHELEADYVVFYEDWWFEELKEQYMENTSQCLEVVKQEGRCTIYEVV